MGSDPKEGIQPMNTDALSIQSMKDSGNDAIPNDDDIPVLQPTDEQYEHGRGSDDVHDDDEPTDEEIRAALMSREDG